MLSRILHRQKTPELTLSDKIRKMSIPLKEKIKTSLRYEDVDVFMSILNTLDEQSDGAFKKEMLLQHLAFDNMNTSYIEPYIEAAFKQQHPEKSKLADTYHQFIQGKNTGVLVSKLLDDRFYNIETFPVYSFLLLGKAGVLMSFLALLIQVLSIALLFKFVAGIYEILILHNGDTIKLKALFQIAKSLKKGVTNEKSK